MIKKKDLILIREANESDMNFIFSTWIQGLFYGNESYKDSSWDAFHPRCRKQLENIFQRPTTKVLVACLKEDPHVDLGYAVIDKIEDLNVLHWVWVKFAWRKIGIARDLIKDPFHVVTHVTKTGLSILESKYPQVKYNSFL